MMLLFQCPSCWADPQCPDCSGVIALGVFWIFALLLMALAIHLSEKKTK
jgi:hypothetical protein